MSKLPHACAICLSRNIRTNRSGGVYDPGLQVEIKEEGIRGGGSERDDRDGAGDGDIQTEREEEEAEAEEGGATEGDGRWG